MLLSARLIHCANSACEDFEFVVSVDRGPLSSLRNGYRGVEPDDPKLAPVGIGTLTFHPATSSPLSASVPEGVQADYREAYLIRTLSPKASATLARRALQGMIRSFWGISKRTLHEELQAIENKCEAGLYDAMMALKSIGNIGAHPEKDISQIVEVEPGEPEELLTLLKILDDEWYVARDQRQRRIAGVIAIGKNKKAGKEANAGHGGGQQASTG